MTYPEAYSKIIDAYFKDEIKPYDNQFCFCGTLAPDAEWRYTWVREVRHDYSYSVQEYLIMENKLLTGIINNLGFNGSPFEPKNDEDTYVDIDDDVLQNENFEDALFEGLSAALDVLKQIHIERGEIIDETPVFTKRQLV